MHLLVQVLLKVIFCCGAARSLHRLPAPTQLSFLRAHVTQLEPRMASIIEVSHSITQNWEQHEMTGTRKTNTRVCGDASLTPSPFPSSIVPIVCSHPCIRRGPGFRGFCPSDAGGSVQGSGTHFERRVPGLLAPPLWVEKGSHFSNHDDHPTGGGGAVLAPSPRDLKTCIILLAHCLQKKEWIPRSDSRPVMIPLGSFPGRSYKICRTL